MVLDSGDGVSHSVPVFEGYCLPHAVQRFPLAGGDVTMQLKRVFSNTFPSLLTALGSSMNDGEDAAVLVDGRSWCI